MINMEDVFAVSEGIQDNKGNLISKKLFRIMSMMPTVTFNFLALVL